jgi:outer membrane protein insertion porin family
MRSIVLIAGLGLAAALLCAMPPAAQTKKAAPKKPRTPAPEAPGPGPKDDVVWPIESVRISGSQLYTSEELAPIAGVKPGEPMTEAALNAARQRLADTGLFASVGYEYKPAQGRNGYAVVFEVADFAERHPVKFARMNKPDEEILTELRKAVPLFRNPMPASQKLRDQTQRALESIVGKVDVRMRSDRPGDLYVLFYPAGQPPVVAEVRFRGSSVIPARTLENTMNGVAVGVEFRESFFLELLRRNVTPLYEARGRILAQYPKITSAPSDRVKGLVITVEVDEGPSFQLGEIAVTGVPEAAEHDLLAPARLKKGDLANFDEVRAAQQRIHNALRRGGFMNVNSTVDRKPNEEAKTVDLTFHIEPGPRYVFGKVTFQGLDIHGEAAVKKMWGLDPGKPFNAEYPDFFLERIREERMFDNLKKTKAVIEPNHKTLVVNVTLVFG